MIDLIFFVPAHQNSGKSNTTWDIQYSLCYKKIYVMDA